jgi:hypothetical protein
MPTGGHGAAILNIPKPAVFGEERIDGSLLNGISSRSFAISISWTLTASRGLIRKVLRGQRSDLFRVRESSLELRLQWLDEQWAAGHRNGAELWRRLKK